MDIISLEDFLEQTICERIGMLLARRMNEMQAAKKAQPNSRKDLISKMDRNTKKQVEIIIDEMVVETADENRYLYLAGIEDGVRIAKTMFDL